MGVHFSSYGLVKNKMMMPTAGGNREKGTSVTGW